MDKYVYIYICGMTLLDAKRDLLFVKRDLPYMKRDLLSIYPVYSIYLSISLSTLCLLPVSVKLSTTYLPTYLLTTYLPICYPSIHPYIHPSICLSNDYYLSTLPIYSLSRVGWAQACDKVSFGISHYPQGWMGASRCMQRIADR